MLKFFSVLLVSLFLFTSNGFSNSRVVKYHSPDKELGNQIAPSKIVYGNSNLRGGGPPIGTIPTGMTGFFDYVTNGNSIRAIQVLGDTIICSFVLCDSTDPTGTTSRVAYYTVSYDNGNSWLPAPIALTVGRSAYPDITPFVGLIGRSVVMNGRSYAPGSRGAAWLDASLGLGAITETLVPAGGRDYFAYQIGGTKIGGAYNVPSDDSLIYISFDYSNSTLGTPNLVATTPEMGASTRQYVAANGDNVTVMWWLNDPNAIQNAMAYKTSTDGGATFGSIQKWLLQGDTFNGDSVTPWFGSDIIYKPGTTQLGAATNTLGFSGGAPNFGTREGYKLLYWSPAVNSGTPTVIADRTNFPTLQDTNLFNQLVDIQVGATAVSHPSIAYSDDGSRLVAFYSGVQTDTLDAFNFNDIYVSYSDDDGATWSSPINVTNTTDWDEMYPSVAKTGNTPGQFHVVFQSTRGPGCQSFTDLTPTYRVWEVYAKVNPLTGAIIKVNNISSEIPQGYSLKQNFPNPFNPTTSIRFEIPQTSKVTLKVYDINGREVATLVNNEVVSAGLNEVTFGGSNLASGVYYYSLQAGDFKQTRKMVLVK